MPVSTFARHQRGMGLLGVIFAIGLAAFFITVLLKVGPLYLNDWTIRSILADVEEQSGEIEGGARGIARQIENRLNVNSVASLSIKDFEFERTDDKTFDVTVGYEQRVHLFFNVDVVAMFEHQVEIKTK